MPLNNFDINSEFVPLFRQFFSQPHTFEEFKALLISRAPISAVHDAIVEKLARINEVDQDAKILELNHKYYKAQISQDEIDKMADEKEARVDVSERAALDRELVDKGRLRDHVISELTKLNNSANVHQRQPAPIMAAPFPSFPVHTHADTVSKELNLRNQLSAIETRISEINVRLEVLAQKGKARAEREEQRIIRIQAKTSLDEKGLLSELCLDDKNHKAYINTVLTEVMTLNSLRDELVTKAKQENYGFFLQTIKATPAITRLTDDEVTAINAITRLIDKYFKHQSTIKNHQDALSSLADVVKAKTNNLAQTRQTLESLKKANPELTTANKGLEQNNVERNSAIAENQSSRSKLKVPGLYLAGIGFLFTIPLALTLVGMIPFFLPPAFMLTLVIAPPAALLIAAIGVGIAALVYTIKNAFHSLTISSNRDLIDGNNNKMAKNIREISELETTTIPQLKVSIKNTKGLQRIYENDIADLEASAAGALRKAGKTVPFSHAHNAKFFTTADRNVHKHPSELGNPHLPLSAGAADTMAPTM